MRSPRFVLLALLPLTLLTVACRTGQVMWGPCSAGSDPWGTDGTYVLICHDGEWRPTMTVAEYVALRRGEHPTLAPLPTRPAPPTTAAPTTAPSTSSPLPTTAPTTSTTTAPTTTISSTTTIPQPPTSPVINGLNPAQGPVDGGEPAVQIFGQAFTGATAVTFDGVAATSFTAVSDSLITAVPPAHAADAVDVVVTGPSGSDTAVGGYEYLVRPTVTGVAPATGPAAGGTTVEITGTGLADVGSVDFGDTAAASFTVVSDTRITAVSPAGSVGTVDVRVTSWGGTSDTTSADAFTYG